MFKSYLLDRDNKIIKLLKNYNVPKMRMCWVLCYLFSDFELLVFIVVIAWGPETNLKNGGKKVKG